MGEGTAIRPYRLGADTAQACELEAAAFTEDYRRMGEDPRMEAGREQRVERLLRWVSRIIPSLRYARMGFVVEVKGVLASVVLFSRDGLRGARWTIDAVGTHPDHQRRGLAKSLIGRSIETMVSGGAETCVLKVRQDNDPAYRLYRGLGFSHFHTSRQMKLDAKAPARDVEIPVIDDLERLKPSAWYSLWRERQDLARRSTSEELQTYKPLVESKFRRPRMIRALGPLVMKLGGMKIEHWALRREGRLMATLVLRADITGHRSHELHIDMDSKYQAAFAAPLVEMGLQRLRGYGQSNILMEVDGQHADVIDALTQSGFEEMSVWHWLGARFQEIGNKGLDNVTV